MKRFMLLGALAALSIMPVCAKGESEAKTGNGQVTIHHWYWVPNADNENYSKLIAEFNATHPNIKVEWENVPQKDVRTKFITAYQVGEGPDTFGMSENWVAEFAAMNMLEPLDGYISKWPGKNDIFDKVWPSSKINNVQYGMPWKLLVTYMYYRKDWFKEEGLSVPQNMDEFVKVAKALTGKYKDESGQTLDRYGFGLRGGRGNAQCYYIWVQSYGAKLYDDKGNVAFNTPLAVEATQKYLDLYQKEKVTPPSAVGDGFSEVVGAFKSGRTAMLHHHIGTYVEITQALGDKVGVMLFPAGPTGYRWSEGSVINHGISSISKNKEAAFTFISWMSEKWAVEFQSRYLGSVPITKSVADLPYFRDNPFYAMSNESVKYVGPWPKTINWASVIDSTTVKLLQQALMGQITAQQMVESISAELAKK